MIDRERIPRIAEKARARKKTPTIRSTIVNSAISSSKPRKQPYRPACWHSCRFRVLGSSARMSRGVPARSRLRFAGAAPPACGGANRAREPASMSSRLCAPRPHGKCCGGAKPGHRMRQYRAWKCGVTISALPG